MRLYITDSDLRKSPSMVYCALDDELERREIIELLSIKVPGAKFSPRYRDKKWDGTKCFFQKFANAFPIGFLNKVTTAFPDAEVLDERSYKPIKFYVPELHGLEQRMYQKEALLWAFEMKNCIIQAATNSGKSAIMAALVKLLRAEGVLIVVHSIELLGQLRAMLMGWTGLNVGIITADLIQADTYVNIAMVKTLLARLDSDRRVFNLFNRSCALIVDECFPGSTQVLMADGKSMKIKEVVRRVNAGEELRVKSLYSLYEDQWVDRRVSRGFVNEHNGVWVKIKFGCRQLKEICTDKHKWYLADGTVSPAMRLRPGDYVKVYPKMTGRFTQARALGDWQEQLLRGGLIGDLGCSETKTTARIRIVHGVKHEGYFNYKTSILRNLIRQRNEKVKTEFSPINGIIRTCTVSTPDIKRIYDEWKNDLARFLNQMDDRGWAFAYMDDGTVDGKICLNSMPKDRADMICRGFNTRYDTSAKIRNEKGWVMVIGRQDMRSFVDRAGRYFLPEMRYKIARYCPGEFVGGWCDPKKYAVLRVEGVSYIQKAGLRYNIEVEDTHNFVAGKAMGVVSNCHHMKSATHLSVFRRSRAVYRIGFSGTVPAEDTYDGWLVRQYIGDVVYNVTNKELIDSGVSAAPIIKLIECYHDVDYDNIVYQIRNEDSAEGVTFSAPWKEKESVYKRVYRRVVEQYIVENVKRNKMIVDRVCGEYKDKQVLIVVDLLKHGELLIDMIDARLGVGQADFIHGDSESRKGSLLAFRAGTLRVLVSSSIIDEGIDISRIELLVLAAGKKSRRQILQRIGRGLRRKEGENVVTVIDFFDYDGKYLEKHSKARFSLYKEEQFEVELLPEDGDK